MHAQLQAQGHVRVPGLLAPALASVLFKTLLLQHWRGETSRDRHMPTSAAATDQAFTDALMLELLPQVEAVAGCALLPTYSYARIYFHGDTLLRHVDRASCEVSVSVNLGCDGGRASLWFQPDVEVPFEPGDGAVYLGCDVSHWRERFEGNALGQLFMHYVRRAGASAPLAFDGHPERFPPSVVSGLTSPLRP